MKALLDLKLTIGFSTTGSIRRLFCDTSGDKSIQTNSVLYNCTQILSFFSVLVRRICGILDDTVAMETCNFKEMTLTFSQMIENLSDAVTQEVTIIISCITVILTKKEKQY